MPLGIPLSNRARIILLGLSFVGVLYCLGRNQHKQLVQWHASQSPVESELQQPALFVPVPPLLEIWDSSFYVNGLPGKTFRDNLRNDTAYVTSWTDGGFTNEFITYVNMIYLGVISDRVPVVPPFAPFHHVDQAAGTLPFGDVFELDHLRAKLRRPVLEWQDVKQIPANGGPEKNLEEPLGCWSAWATGHITNGQPREAHYLTSHLGIDISYSAVPKSTRRAPEDTDDWFIQFWPLAALIYPGERTRKDQNPLSHLHTPTKGRRLGLSLLPDEHLSCFDFLYFVTASQESFEWEHGWSPAWNAVGTHLRFTPVLVDLAESYLRRLWNLDEGSNIPPFIAVHIRRGDFSSQGCERNLQDLRAIDKCFAPFDAYIRTIVKVQHQLDSRGVHISNWHVLITSDEGSPVFWDRVISQGYSYIDHDVEHTFEQYGEWYLILLDAVFQSLAIGFVGTDESTVSLISERRVRDWNGGVTESILSSSMPQIFAPSSPCPLDLHSFSCTRVRGMNVEGPIAVSNAGGCRQDKISAYYSLVFPNFTYYLQTLAVTIGRRCLPATATTPSTSTVDNTAVDVDLGPLKSVSRLHAKIEYEQDRERFVLVVVGRNGAWVDGTWASSGSRVVLGERSQIQIASRSFDFVLPPPPAPDDSPSPSSQEETRPRSPSLEGIRGMSPSMHNYSPPPSASPTSMPKIPPIRPKHLPKSNHSAYATKGTPTSHGGKGKSVPPSSGSGTPRPQLSFPVNAGKPKEWVAKPEATPPPMDFKGKGKPKGKVGRLGKVFKAALIKSSEFSSEQASPPPMSFDFEQSNAYDYGDDDDDDLEMVEIAPRMDVDSTGGPPPLPPPAPVSSPLALPTQTPGASSSKTAELGAVIAPKPTAAQTAIPAAVSNQPPTPANTYAPPPVTTTFAPPTTFGPPTTQAYVPNGNFQPANSQSYGQQDTKPVRMKASASHTTHTSSSSYKSSPFTSKPKPSTTGGAFTKAPATGPFGYASGSGPVLPRPPKRKKGDDDQSGATSNEPAKPLLTYAQLCYRAITALGGKATLDEINGWVMDQFEYYRVYENTGWKNSVRHNLSSAPAFQKMDRAGGDRKGYFWSVHPEHEHTFRDTKDVPTQPVQPGQHPPQPPAQAHPQPVQAPQPGPVAGPSIPKDIAMAEPTAAATPQPKKASQPPAAVAAAPGPQVAQWPQQSMPQHNPYYGYAQSGQPGAPYYAAQSYNAYMPQLPAGGDPSAAPSGWPQAWPGAAAAGWGGAPQQWPAAGNAWAASSTTPWAATPTAQPSPVPGAAILAVVQSPLAVPSPAQPTASPMPSSPTVAAIASPSPAPAIAAAATSATSTMDATASLAMALDPALQFKITVGLVPSSTGGDVSSPSPATAITVHDNSFYLDPVIFGHLDPQTTAGLEGLGSAKALEILQGYHTKYLQAKGKTRGTKKRGRGKGGASASTRAASASVEPTTPSLKAAVAAIIQSPSAGPQATSPIPQGQPQPIPHGQPQMHPMMGWYGYGQQAMYPGYPYGAWQPPSGYPHPQYQPQPGYPPPGAYPPMQPGQHPYYQMPIQHYPQMQPQPHQPAQSPPVNPAPVSGASASPIIVVDDSDEEVVEQELPAAKRRKMAA